MQFSTHLLVGVVVGEAAAAAGGAPWLAFLAGVGSHAALDMVPHHDYHHARYAVLDLLAGVGLALSVSNRLSGAGWWGGLGGAAPDLEVAVDHILLSLGRRGIRSRFPSHTGALPHPSCSPLRGVLIQVIFVALGLYMLRR